MVREARQRSSDGRLIDDLSVDALLLVAGADANTSHSRSCRELATRTGVTIPFRVCADESRNATVLGAAEPYVSGAGNHVDLELSEAGLVATESIANISVDGGLDGIHLCVDGMPTPESQEGRQTLYRFIYTLTRAVSNNGCGCHVHLSAEGAGELVDTFAPLFDSVIEVGHGEQYRVGEWDASAGAWQVFNGRRRD